MTELKNNPKVSIIMPVFNVERFLKEAIESILDQTLKDFEFIIINDNSTDNSSKIIEEYRRKDDRIIIINNRQNLGIAKSLNLGLKIAKGKYIARMDGDDISDKKRIEIQYNFLEKNKDIFLLGTGSEKIDERGNIISIFNPIISKENIKKELLKKNCFRHSSIMVRNSKDFFYREKMHYVEDYDLYLRLISNNKILKNLPFYLVKYRVRDKSISLSNAGKQYLFSKKAKEFYFQKLNYNRDDYGSFNPKEILEINIDKSNDKNLLKEEVKANFKIDNFKKVRIFSKRYFKNYGFLNEITIYYLLSFLGNFLINLIRKIIFFIIPVIYINIINSFYEDK